MADGRYSADENMRVDAALLADCGQGRIPPTVRLYGWSEPSITIGYSQNAEAELNLQLCRDLGVPVVRRPTGGRALLHGNELTYAVVAPVSIAPFNQGLKATFAAISEALLAGLQELGIHGEVNVSKQQLGAARTPACFASLNHCEITVDGKKLIGSAQKRTSQAFLQHGSVIIDSDHDLFATLLSFKDESQREVTRNRLAQSTTTLNEVCARRISFEEVRDALQEGFQKTLGDVCLKI